MLDYFLLIPVWFLLMNALPAFGAFCLARRLHGERDFAGTASSALLLYFLVGGASFGIAGAAGFLNGTACGILAGAAGIVMIVVSGGWKRLSIRDFSLPERILAAVAAGLCIVRFFIVSYMHSGTDTWLYHLYFPSSWLGAGKIFPIPIPELMCEYYPVYAECVYGWFLLPAGDSSFALYPQVLASAMAGFALIAAGRSFGFSRSVCLGAACLMLFPGIIGENAVMAYSDVMTGSFLLAGTSLLLTGALRRKTGLGILGGIAFGVAASLKYSGLLLATPAALGLFVFLTIRHRKRLNFVLAAAASAVLAAIPAYLGTFLRTGNPFYPVRIPLLFSNGMDFSRESVGFGPGTVGYFVTGNIWDMNGATLAVYLILPFLVFAAGGRRKIFLFLAVTVPALLALQLKFYPSMTQPRQIIPLMMYSSILFLPVLGWVRRICGKREFLFPAGILALCVPLSLTGFWMKTAQSAMFLIPFAGILSLSKKGFFRILVGSACVFFCLTPWIFRSRFTHREMYNAMFAGEAASRAAETVWRDYSSDWRPRGIVSVWCWMNFMFQEDMPGNEVVAIPVNRKNSLHPHEFSTMAEMRADPVSYSEWRDRVFASKASYLAALRLPEGSGIPHSNLELSWALEHPETFLPEVSDGRFFFFRIRGKND